MKKIIITSCLIFLVMSCSNNTKKIVKTSTQEFAVEVVTSETERAQGLMNRSFLEKNNGMLFVLKNEGRHGFWMKNTLIPLDIIWISADKKVVDIKTAQPCQTKICETFFPQSDALFVLEVNANEFEGKIGDIVNWK